MTDAEKLLRKQIKELVITLLCCDPTDDEEIVDFNVECFMLGIKEYTDARQSKMIDLKDKES